MTVGAILLADDDETFRESTSRLLRREGFDCRCVKDAEEAVGSLRQGRFDVLVSDIRMPHNPDMRIVREARNLDGHLPIILVTGYPSAETAIHGIELAVDAYLTKPLDIDDLMDYVRKAVKRSHIRRRLAAVVARLHSVVAELETETPQPDTDGIALPAIRTLASCLSELLTICGKPASSLCDLLDCPQRPAHRQAILDAIEVLERTKDNFKSKQLAELRTRLEHALGIGCGCG
jgi:DNA-binding response OmpR family regulator